MEDIELLIKKYDTTLSHSNTNFERSTPHLMDKDTFKLLKDIRILIKKTTKDLKSIVYKNNHLN